MKRRVTIRTKLTIIATRIPLRYITKHSSCHKESSTPSLALRAKEGMTALSLRCPKEALGGGGGPFSPSHAQHDLETIGLTLLKAGEFLQRRYGDFQKETTSTTLALAAEGNVVRIQNSKHCINNTGYSIYVYVYVM